MSSVGEHARATAVLSNAKMQDLQQMRVLQDLQQMREIQRGARARCAS